MKRLTEKEYSVCTDCDGIGHCRTDCSYKQFYDRLAAYEDTGLEPEEMQGLCEMDKRSRMVQMLRWEQAEAEGRLLILPCKVGDTVYRIIDDCTLPGDCGTKMMCKGCEYRNLFIEEVAFHLYELTDSGGLHSRYYTSREEAEKALEDV